MNLLQINSVFVPPPSRCLIWAGMMTCLTLFMSCKNAEPVQSENLYGKWEITKAEKNGKETDYLRNGYFIISPDGKMTVNITGEDENGTYMIEKEKIMMEGNKTFEIQSLQGDSMVVKYVINPNARFVFYMVKGNEDVQ